MKKATKGFLRNGDLLLAFDKSSRSGLSVISIIVMKLIILFLLIPVALFADATVILNESNGHKFYHLEYTLRKDDFVLEAPVEWVDGRYPENDGEPGVFEASGAFSIYVRKASFPIPAPNCRSER